MLENYSSAEVQMRLNHIYAAYTANIPAPRLRAAMQYTLDNGGKYLRPLLVYAVGALLNAPLDHLDLAAACIELIHSYSLIHDDLPCMDDADLRRGKPSCHIAYDEAHAVLVGDALLTLSFALLGQAELKHLSAHRQLAMIAVLAHAAGVEGMVGGQALDIAASNHQPSITEIYQMHALKTGALFVACFELSWLASDNHDLEMKKKLLAMGKQLGLAFQIQDDILDIESTSECLGKPQAIDSKNNKLNSAAILGLHAAKAEVARLLTAVDCELANFGEKATPLRTLIDQILHREK